MNPIRFLRSLPIRDKFLVTFLVFFIPLASIGTAIVYHLVKTAIQANIESELRNTSAIIRNMVRTAATVSIRNRLRAIAEKNLEITRHIYGKFEQGRISRLDAVAQIRDLYESQTIGKTGYIYAIDSSGTAVLHPMPGVEGRNFADFPFIQEQIRKKQGYIEYDWKNPGEQQERPKALYMAYFEPLDWIISVSTYREEFLELVDIEDFRNSLLSMKFGASGYPYIASGNGGIILHPELEGRNIFQVPGVPSAFYREMIQRKNGQIRYTWKNPGDPVPREKLVFFNYLPEYDWIVAASSYIDEVFAPLYRVRNVVLVALVAALVVAATITFLLTDTISRPLKALMAKFAEGERGNFAVRMAYRSEDELGQLARYFNSFMDRLNTYSGKLNQEILERRQAAEALQKSERRHRRLYAESRRNEELYRSLLDATPDAIVVYDMDGRVRFINPSFTDIFGWTFPELEGKRVPFVPDSEREETHRLIQALIEDGTRCRGFETRRFTKNGDILEISISAARYHDHQGTPAGMVAILRDISETKRLEAQILHSQRMEAIGTLAGGIAHDFNNLLMGIQGRTSLLLSDITPEDPFYEHLVGIEDHVRGASRLTAQLLGFARGGKYEVKATDINRLIRKCAELFGRTRKDVEIRLDLKDSIAPVEVDQSQMEQVLLNLYVNAGQAMPDGGILKLASDSVSLTGEETGPPGLIRGDYVVFIVSDTGVGMDDDVRQRIFDPFFTTKERSRGTGLGLSSVYGIVTNHGGAITVTSTKGAGATFRVYLPASSKSVRDAATVATTPMPGSGTILLVDDEAMNLEITQKMLDRLGYGVISCSNGAEAVALFERRKNDIDLVILDMVMPGMPADQVFARLRSIDPEVRVLLSSGYSLKGEAAGIMRKGCSGFIQKPYNLGALSEKLREVMNHPTA